MDLPVGPVMRLAIWIVSAFTFMSPPSSLARPTYCDLIPDSDIAQQHIAGCFVDGNAPETTTISIHDLGDIDPLTNTLINTDEGETREPDFEGDINGIDPLALPIPGPNTQANGIKDTDKQWPNAEIPYILSSYYRENHREIIKQAMDVFHKHTCVKFRKKQPDDNDYIHLLAGIRCNSFVGKVGGQQFVELAIPGCMLPGIVEHELMHAVGFYHEQSRTDRDDYVKINWPNIAEADKKEFQKYSYKEVTAFGESYDFNSVMHYNENEFGVRKEPGQWTIKPKLKWHFKGKLGQRDGLSETDIKKINFMYNCTQAGPCPTSKGWMNYEDKCYFLSFAADDSSRKTFVGARNFCRTQGAIIAGPSSTVIKKFLVAQITLFPGVETDENVWISSCRVISVDNPWPSDDDCLTKSYFVCQRNAVDVSASSVSQDES